MEVFDNNFIGVREVESRKNGQTRNGLYHYVHPIKNKFKDDSCYVKGNICEKVKCINDEINLPLYFNGDKFSLLTKFKKMKGEKLKELVEYNQISIKKIQDSLILDTDLFELDFQDRLVIMITKNDLFVKNCNFLCCLNNIKKWKFDYYDNFKNYNVEYISDIDDDVLNDILKKMIRECRYGDISCEVPLDIVCKVDNSLKTFYINRNQKDMCIYCDKELEDMICPKCLTKYIKNNLLFCIPDSEPDVYGVYYNFVYFYNGLWYLATKIYKVDFITKELVKNEVVLRAVYRINNDSVYDELNRVYAYKDNQLLHYYIDSFVYYIDFKNASKELLKYKDTIDSIIKEEGCISLFRLLYSIYFSKTSLQLRSKNLLRLSFDKIYSISKDNVVSKKKLALSDEETLFCQKYDMSYKELVRYRETKICDYEWIKATSSLLVNLFINYDGVNVFTNKVISSFKEYNKYQKIVDNYFKDNEEVIYRYFKKNKTKINRDNIRDYIIKKISEMEV